jgi:hypothetical protein
MGSVLLKKFTVTHRNSHIFGIEDCVAVFTTGRSYEHFDESRESKKQIHLNHKLCNIHIFLKLNLKQGLLFLGETHYIYK